MDFLDSDSVSKEELIRVILESQKKVANLTNQMNEKEKTLQQITKELHDTQKKLNDVVVSDVSENLSSNVKDNEILNDHHVDLKCENDDNVKLDKLFVDDKAQRIAPRKRGRPKKRDSDYTSRSNTKGVKKLHKHKSPRLGEVTENDIDILSMTAIEEESYNIALKVETDDFDSITVYSENNSNIKEYVVTVVGPTPVCHICDVIFESVSKLAEHYANEHKHGISVNEDETKITVCKVCGRWYMTSYDLKRHRRMEHCENNEQVYIEVHAAYTTKAELLPPLTEKPSEDKLMKMEDIVLHIVEEASEYEKPRLKTAYVPLLGPFKYVCYYCPARFRHKEYCHGHIRQKHFFFTSPFLCQFCGKTFTSRLAHQSHIKSKHSPPLYSINTRHICEVCGKKFTNKNNMRRHVRCHTNSHPFTCSYCDQAFTQRGTLATHLRIHGFKDKYLCEYCCRGYMSNIKLHEHIQHKHKGIYIYKCFICDTAVDNSDDLKAHFMCHKSTESEQPFKCHICEFQTFFPRELQSHLRAHQRGIMRVPPRRRETGKRRVRKGPFICRFCDKRCSGKDYLDLHEFKHTKQKKYTCETCGRQFTMAPQLRAHMETKHEGLRYLCEICGKNFTVFANVQRHVIEVHGKQRPYSCYVCKKSFSQKISLKVHERTERHRRMLIRGYDF